MSQSQAPRAGSKALRAGAEALRAGAEGLGVGLPALLAEADRLAATLALGEHGRRRAGMGEAFWQYRPAHSGDAAKSIDWRRSARSDAHFVREQEWLAAQAVTLWVDQGASMRFASARGLPDKIDRARLWALAVAILLLRGGERVGLVQSDDDPAAPILPRAGRAQAALLAQALLGPGAQGDHAQPLAAGLGAAALVVMLSDFLGDPAPVERALAEIAGRGGRAILVQVLDPAERDFPYAGRVIFRSVAGSLSHETRQAGDLAQRYRQRLAERQDRLDRLARQTGGRFGVLDTGMAAAEGLQWIYRAVEGARP